MNYNSDSVSYDELFRQLVNVQLNLQYKLSMYNLNSYELDSMVKNPLLTPLFALEIDDNEVGKILSDKYVILDKLSDIRHVPGLVPCMRLIEKFKPKGAVSPESRACIHDCSKCPNQCLSGSLK